jgi:alpha-galactosidase
MVVSNEKNHAVVFVVQVLSQPNEKSHILKLKGLKEEATYEVREVSVANGSKRLWGTYSGDVLMYAGLIVAREMADFTGLCLELTEIL